jgi:hypothetical protein
VYIARIKKKRRKAEGGGKRGLSKWLIMEFEKNKMLSQYPEP